eukprot:1099761-Karenia_brevis.AAC.2
MFAIRKSRKTPITWGVSSRDKGTRKHFLTDSCKQAQRSARENILKTTTKECQDFKTIPISSAQSLTPVSYTHLTLPTICSV